MLKSLHTTILLALSACSGFDYTVQVSNVTTDIDVEADGHAEDVSVIDGVRSVLVERQYSTYSDAKDDGIRIRVMVSGVAIFERIVSAGSCDSSHSWDGEITYLSVVADAAGENQVVVSGSECLGGGRSEVTVP